MCSDTESILDMIGQLPWNEPVTPAEESAHPVENIAENPELILDTMIQMFYNRFIDNSTVLVDQIELGKLLKDLVKIRCTLSDTDSAHSKKQVRNRTELVALLKDAGVNFTGSDTHE